MENAKAFAMWFLENIPDFLMSEPIVYIVGLFVLAVVIKFTYSLMHLK